MNSDQKIKFKFFKIEKLGYYNKDNSESFPQHKDIFQNLSDWGKSQANLINTSCYETDEEENLFNTYFYDYESFNNEEDAILIL